MVTRNEVKIEKNLNTEFDLISYKPDENGFCHEPCHYGQGWTDEEYEDIIRFDSKFNVSTPVSQTYLIGTAPCVRRCKYSRGKPEGVYAVMCAYKYQN